MTDELVKSLREADSGSVQRALGSRIFGEAADRIQSLTADNAVLRAIAERAIDAVKDAEREADWNIPTFGPTTSEQLAAELNALSQTGGE